MVYTYYANSMHLGYVKNTLKIKLTKIKNKKDLKSLLQGIDFTQTKTIAYNKSNSTVYQCVGVTVSWKGNNYVTYLSLSDVPNRRYLHFNIKNVYYSKTLNRLYFSHRAFYVELNSIEDLRLTKLENL